jgi:hypothetical protein
MAQISLPITPSGVIIEAYVFYTGARIQAMSAASQVPQSPVRARLIVDTGATRTFLDPGIIQALHLTPTGVAAAHTASSGANPVPVLEYAVSLFLPLTGQTKIVDPLPILESHLRPSGVDGLLGCDVLNDGILLYDGPNRRCTLTF